MIIDIWGNIVAEKNKRNWTDFSSFELKERLTMAEKQDVDIRFNSMGGSVIEGSSMNTLIANYESKTTTHLMGMCGSIATIAFLAGDERVVYPTSQFFIHEATGVRTDDLEQMNNMMANIYAEATGKTVEFFREEMKKETTYYGAEILEMGFATKMGEQLKAVALLDIYNKPQTVKEPKMAMTDQEKAEFEALKAENLTLKENAEAKKCEAEAEKLEFAKAFLAQETERKEAIMACVRYPEQKEVAEALYKEGATIVEAKAKIFDHFLANEQSFSKKTAIAQLEDGAPMPSGGDDGEGVMTAQALKIEWQKLKASGDIEGAKEFFNTKIKGVK